MDDAELGGFSENTPGFGWLKGPDTAAKKQKIALARKQLQGRKDPKSLERAKVLDQAMARFEKPGEKPGEKPDANDLELSPKDRQFNAKMSRMPSMAN